ncbi:MAG TPA: FGGY-family carbohydrate kinase [Smithellaceae bacterium]|nr:FGGY-family carbohydrate kinase [Smithellaceae bacterium]HRS89945.1 FGGY-family carbohydrate kinase [Smithellaceae bacterium]HRV26781.1 FGGY-family carbohydrate kinase [Smithellaceae bacterium]
MSNEKNTTKELILSVDAGTQSIRAAFIDPDGNILHIVKTPIQPYFSQHPGWAEQQPDYYWEVFCKTTGQLLQREKNLKNNIKGVTLTTQRATMINVDKDGRPLRPAITWLDQRKADSRGILPGALRPVLKIIGLLNTLEGVIQECEANWISQQQPEIWEKTYKYLVLSGFFTHRLTGEFVDSTGNNIGYLPFNKKTYQWAGKYDFKWWIFNVEKEKLPALVKPSEILGRITKKASVETGIPEGLPVFAAGSDKGCEILGSGCLTPETGCLSFGTIATFDVATPKYIELQPMIPPYPASVPDAYYTEVSIFRGFWMVSWFKEEFGLQECMLAEKSNEPAEKFFDSLIRDIPAGSMGLMLQPYWTPGRDLDPYAKGSVIGFGDVHSRAYLYRALLEGLVYGLREGGELTQRKTKIPITKLTVSGGGSQSDVAMQITADVFGMGAHRPHTFETSALGAAIDAAVGLKLYGDFPSAVKAMTRTGRVFEPIKDNHELYDNLYRKVYLKMYKRLKPLFKEIRDITGYPPKN